MAVNAIAGEHAAQRRIGKCPFAGIEAIALIDKGRLCCRKHKRRYVVVPVM
jgi:hypothetical protein